MPVAGRELRMSMTRRTASGEFLAEIVKAGLIRRTMDHADGPFYSHYELTELGKHAAEFGEFEGDPARLTTV
jgi:DNA-binding HxlR family transcriptional regulator